MNLQLHGVESGQVRGIVTDANAPRYHLCCIEILGAYEIW